MLCIKSPMVMLLGLMVMTAGFFLTMAGWFAPVKNDAVLKVRLTGPLCLGTGFALLILSCLCCAMEQNNCECDDAKKDGSIEIQDLPQTRPLIVHDLASGDDVNTTHESTCNNSPAMTRESCLSLEHARNDSPVALDRRKVTSLQSHSGSRHPYSPVIHANRHVRHFLKQERTHKQPIVRPPSYKEVLHVKELSDGAVSDPWEMQC